MRGITVNGAKGVIFEDRRVPAEQAPEGFPHRYETRHPDSNWAIPATVEERVTVNFHGTLFTAEPLSLKDGLLNVRSFSVEGGPSYDTMEGVCPDCGDSLRSRTAVLKDGVLLVDVLCLCGFEGVEVHRAGGILDEADDLAELPEDDPALKSVPDAVREAAGKDAADLASYAVGDDAPERKTLEVPLRDGTVTTLVLLTAFDEIRREKAPWIAADGSRPL